jgi:hypothetical protein
MKNMANSALYIVEAATSSVSASGDRMAHIRLGNRAHQVDHESQRLEEEDMPLETHQPDWFWTIFTRSSEPA